MRRAIRTECCVPMRIIICSRYSPVFTIEGSKQLIRVCWEVLRKCVIVHELPLGWKDITVQMTTMANGSKDGRINSSTQIEINVW